MYYNSNPNAIMHQKYQNFFNGVERALKNEFADYQRKIEIVNEYSINRTPLLTVQVYL